MKTFYSKGLMKPLLEYEVGEMGGYINDSLRNSVYARTELSEAVFMALAKTVEHPARNVNEFPNKDFVCVNVDSDNGSRTFIYKHDFRVHLFVVRS